jgi:hypothetical protein
MGKVSKGISLPKKWIEDREAENGKKLLSVKVNTVGKSLVIEPCTYEEQIKQPQLLKVDEALQSPQEVEVSEYQCKCGKRFNAWVNLAEHRITCRQAT